MRRSQSTIRSARIYPLLDTTASPTVMRRKRERRSKKRKKKTVSSSLNRTLLGKSINLHTLQ
jgi:2-iminoacetate synthase ThiH